jgi:hypothetical protein
MSPHSLNIALVKEPVRDSAHVTSKRVSFYRRLTEPLSYDPENKVYD